MKIKIRTVRSTVFSIHRYFNALHIEIFIWLNFLLWKIHCHFTRISVGGMKIISCGWVISSEIEFLQPFLRNTLIKIAKAIFHQNFHYFNCFTVSHIFTYHQIYEDYPTNIKYKLYQLHYFQLILFHNVIKRKKLNMTNKKLKVSLIYQWFLLYCPSV